MDVEVPPVKEPKEEKKKLTPEERKFRIDIITIFVIIFSLIVLYFWDPFNIFNPVSASTTTVQIEQKTNLQKFNEIDLDLEQAGINVPALQAQFKADPLACRIPVEHHKRKRFMLVTKEHEKAFGRHFINEMHRLNILCNDEKLLEKGNRVLKRFKDVMPEGFTPPEQIYILDTPEVNACCLPDGTIVVFKGLIEKFNDDELAAVIGHELAHGIARHSAEKISKAIIQEMAIKVFIEQDNDHQLMKFIGSKIAAFFTNLQYSRSQENEADRLAILYMQKAGFNSQGFINVMESFNLQAGKRSAFWEYLSTHPHPEKRLENIKTAIADLNKNPDIVWGGLKMDLLEAAKVKAIKIYLKKQQQKTDTKQD